MEAEETATESMVLNEKVAVPEYKGDVDGKSEDIDSDAVPMTVDNDCASETGLSRKNRFYISITFLLIVIVGAGLSLVYDNMRSVISPPVKHTEISGTVENKRTASPAVNIVSPPSFSDKALDRESINMSESGTPFPSFREDILEKLLSE